MHRRAGKIILVLLGFALPLLAAESALRMFPDIPLVPSDPARIWEHWRPQPRLSSRQLTAIFNHDSRYDHRLGFIRKSLIEEEKTFVARPGYRVVFLGDSITEDGPFREAMMTGLRLLYPPLTFNFLNAGVVGWDTRQEFHYLQSRADVLRPDLVFVQFCLNDLQVTPVFWQDADGQFYAFSAGAWGPYLSSALVSHSRLVRRLGYLAAGRVPLKQAPDYAKVREYFARLVRLARARRFELRLVLFPYFDTPEEETRAMHGELVRIIKDLKIEKSVIDLFDLPENHDATKWRKVEGDGTHPNEKGAQVLSQTVLGRMDVPALNEVRFGPPGRDH